MYLQQIDPQEPMSPVQRTPTPLIPRGAAFVLDLLIVTLLASALEISAIALSQQMPLASLWFPTWFLYHAGFESSRFQATPGKGLCGLYTHHPFYGRLTFWQASLRTLSKFVDAFFSFTLLPIWLTSRITLTDWWLGSSVIQRKP